MSDIKSIGHQSIHSTQSAAEEGSQKNSEIVKEYKPAEFRPLSNEQKENIKQTRHAENKMAESALMSGITRGLEEYNKGSDKSLSTAAGSDNVKNEPSKEFVKAGGPQETTKEFVKDQNEFLPTQTGPIAEYNSSEPVLKAEKFFPSIRFGNPSRPDDDLDSREDEYYHVVAEDSSKSKAENNLTESPIRSKTGKRIPVKPTPGEPSDNKRMYENWQKELAARDHVNKHEEAAKETQADYNDLKEVLKTDKTKDITIEGYGPRYSTPIYPEDKIKRGDS